MTNVKNTVNKKDLFLNLNFFTRIFNFLKNVLSTNQKIVISRNTSERKENTLELIFLIKMVVLPSIATLKKPVKCPISLCQRLCDTYLFSRWVKDSMRPISATTAWISRRRKKLN